MQEVQDYLKAAKTYYIATVDGEQARVRPFGTANIFEDKLYIQTGKSKDVYRQIIANPKIEICASGSDGDWIRIAATALEDNRLEAQESMLEAYPELKGMYAAGDGNNVVLYLKDATATIYSFTGEPKVIEF